MEEERTLGKKSLEKQRKTRPGLISQPELGDSMCLSKQLVREQYHCSSPHGKPAKNKWKSEDNADAVFCPCWLFLCYGLSINQTQSSSSSVVIFIFTSCIQSVSDFCGLYRNPLQESSIATRGTKASMWIIMFMRQPAVYVVEKQAYLNPNSRVDVISSGIWGYTHTHMCLIDRIYNSMCTVCICVCGLEGSKQIDTHHRSHHANPQLCWALTLR